MAKRSDGTITIYDGAVDSLKTARGTVTLFEPASSSNLFKRSVVSLNTGMGMSMAARAASLFSKRDSCQHVSCNSSADCRSKGCDVGCRQNGKCAPSVEGCLRCKIYKRSDDDEMVVVREDTGEVIGLVALDMQLE